MAFRRLADYIERIQPSNESTPKSSNRPFNNGTAKNPPRLRPHGVNRILLFPGSFNPPHQGHLKLLKHIFENAGEDLHVIGAIILPTDDEMLKNKMAQRDNAIMLSREQRVNLWRGDGIPVDWAWVYDKPEASWAEFRTKLMNELSNDQIELKFTLLCGPDAITADGGYNPEYWDCPDSITSDISRPVDFRYPNTLRQLAGCSPWERLSYDQGRLERQIRAKLKGKQASVIEEELAKAFNKLSTISICRRLRKPKGTIRFLPCSLDQRPADAPSSTKIREVIASSPQDVLEKKLEGIAMHPKLLVEYVKTLPKPVKAAEAAKEQTEKEKWERIIW